MNQFIAVIGGDARYLELIRQLKILPNTTIILVGFDKIEQSFTGLKQVPFEDLPLGELDAVILPITGTNKDGKVETVFSDQDIHLTHAWFKELKQSTCVFTGITNDYLTTGAEAAQLSLISLLDRDDVAIYNSIPTAEGTIMMAMEHTDYTLHSSRICVTGFGRVGHTVANKLSALGAKVSVSAKSIKDLARITEMGLAAVALEDLNQHAENVDILINTIPAPVIEKSIIQQLPAHGLIIDLASKPGGTDFEFAEKRGIKSILARSLPGTVAPKTAGKILADVVKQLLKSRNKRDSNKSIEKGV